MPEAVPAAKGTRPEGAESEAEASRKVREMFTQIAPRYDLLNHLLSLQLDRVWRARAARRLQPILQRPGAMALDLCCGTGDLAFALARVGNACMLGADFSHTMLVRAKEKSGAACGAASATPRGTGHPRALTAARECPSAFTEADALRLPFTDNCFDLVATAFGFRNLANYEAGLREILRVLKPGGTIAILEFSEPPPGLLGDLYRWYFRHVLPRIGGLISGDCSAYSYLPTSVSRFFGPAELSALMSNVGYAGVQAETWTCGTVALHTGVKT